MGKGGRSERQVTTRLDNSGTSPLNPARALDADVLAPGHI